MNNLEKWAKEEIKLQLKECDNDWYTKNVLKCAYKVYKKLCRQDHSGASIQLVKSVLDRLIDVKPLSPIEDTPAEDPPSPAHSPLYMEGVSAEDVIVWFNEVCLDAEVGTGDQAHLVQKWMEPIIYRVSGSPTDTDIQTLESFTFQFNLINGFPGMREMDEDGFYNLDIHFCTGDELVEIMLEVAMNRSPTIKIGRDAEYPTGFVQQRFEQITAMHIEKVLDGIRENTTRVWNTRAYLMAALFNSVSTIDNHYAMLVNHDFNGSP